MRAGLDSIGLFKYAILMSLLAIGRGRNSCSSITSRPHPDGTCGPQLARAHSNLCFLLALAHPDYFLRKRTSSDEMVERIYSIPIPVLAEVTLTKDNWGMLLNKRGQASHTAFKTFDQVPEFPSLNEESPKELSPTRQWASELLQLLKGARVPHKRNGESNMVCDCCYNVCTTADLATYC